jgi:hypothetical protein
MLDTIKKRARDGILSWLGPLPTTAVATPSSLPLGIDQRANLPVHYEPPECPLCRAPEGQCFDCGGRLADPDAPFGTGVESATVTHLHMRTIPDSGGRQIRVLARRKLCIPCFRLDWAKLHPETPCDL